MSRTRIKIPQVLTRPNNPLINNNGNLGQANSLWPIINWLNGVVPLRDQRNTRNRNQYYREVDGAVHTYVADLNLRIFDLRVMKKLSEAGCKIDFVELFFKYDPTAPVVGSLVPESGPTPTWTEWLSDKPRWQPIMSGGFPWLMTRVFDPPKDMEVGAAIALLGFDNLALGHDLPPDPEPE